MNLRRPSKDIPKLMYIIYNIHVHMYLLKFTTIYHIYKKNPTFYHTDNSKHMYPNLASNI